MKQSANENHLGVISLSREEEIETSGGIAWYLPALVAALVGSAMNNIQDFREGFMDGYNGTPRH